MKQPDAQPRIALLMMDCAWSQPAVSRFISRQRNHIGVVIASNPFRKQGGVTGRQLWRRLLQAGAGFMLFLAYGFIWFPFLLDANYFFSRLFGRIGRRIPVKRLCQNYQIEYRRSNNINDQQFIQLLRSERISLVVTCFFDQILGAELIKASGTNCVNVHPGLLPECRGVFPEIHTAAGKCAGFGVTVHRIDDATIDTGGILMRKTVEITGSDNLLAIGRRLLAEGLTGLEEMLPELPGKLAQVQPQGTGSYYTFPSKRDIRRLHQAGYRLLGRQVIDDIFQLVTGG